MFLVVVERDVVVGGFDIGQLAVCWGIVSHVGISRGTSGGLGLD